MNHSALLRNTPRNAIDKQLLRIATSGFVIILPVKQITETEQSLVELQLYVSAKSPYSSTFCKTFPSIPHTFQHSSSLGQLLWDQSQDLLTSTNSGSHLKAHDHILTLPSQSLHLKHNTKQTHAHTILWDLNTIISCKRHLLLYSDVLQGRLVPRAADPAEDLAHVYRCWVCDAVSVALLCLLSELQHVPGTGSRGRGQGSG